MNIGNNSREILRKIEDKSARVGIVGFGYIGTILGAIIADSGFHVVGIDVDETHLKRLQSSVPDIVEPGLEALLKKQLKNNRLTLSANYGSLDLCDILIVTVGTPVGEDYNSDLSQFTSAITAMQPYVNKQKLVVIKSTVPPLTTEQLAFKTLYGPEVDQEDVLFAFCPERIALGNAIHEFKTIPVIVGGMNRASNTCVSSFFKSALGVDTVETSSPRTAEMVKLADNLWIDLNIALGNELAMLSDGLGIDVLEIIQASNTLAKGNSNVNILLPSVGVGGSCLPKDPHFLLEFGKRMGLDLQIPKVSRSVNDSMPAYSVARIESAFAQHGKELKGSRIAVLGLAYKNNTGDCRETPAVPFIRQLLEKGADVRVFDPLVDAEEAKRITGIDLNKDLSKCTENADCVAFVSGHDIFRNIDLTQLAGNMAKHCHIFDGRMYFSKDAIEQMKRNGLQYIGVGR